MIYDISQNVFGCRVYPNDPAPESFSISSMNEGELYNLSSFSMCAHNGTHIDAPAHFIKDGKTVEQIELSKLIGPSYVKEHEGILTAEDAEAILRKAKSFKLGAEKRILIKGDAIVSEAAAKRFADEGIFLIGTESQSVGPVDSPMAVHLILLKAELVLLEGLELKDIKEGVYTLYCAALKLNGFEGAPVRAILIGE